MAALTACAWLFWHALVLGLPVAVGVAAAQRLGVTRTPLLLAIGMCTLGLAGMATFWMYLASRDLGRAFSIAVEVGCAVALAVLVRQGRGGRQLWRALGRPGLLYLATATWVTSLGYLYTQVQPSWLGPANRFVRGLPDDDEIPFLFARQLFNPARPLPHVLVGNWQSSDRPPLQTGMYLLDQGMVHTHRYLDYELVGILAQSLWVLGLWAIFEAFGAPAKLRALATAVVAFSGFTIVNTFFTWPKLLPGAFLLVALALVLDRRVRLNRGAALAAGTSIGIAMLAHPGSAFIVLALLVTVLVVRVRIPWRAYLWAAAGAAMAYIPWLAYQRWYDPPGNKLDALQLANLNAVPKGESLMTAVTNAYRAAGTHNVIHNKLSNLRFPFDYTTTALERQFTVFVHGPNSVVASNLRSYNFYFLFPSLGLMTIGPLLFIGLALSRRVLRADGPLGRPAISLCRDSIVLLVLSYVIWGLTLFGPHATVIHQGSYLVPLLALAIGCVCWWEVSPRLAAAVGLAQVAVTVFNYAGMDPNRIVNRTTQWHPHASVLGVVLLVLASVLTFAVYVWIARGRDVVPDEPTADTDVFTMPARTVPAGVLEAAATGS